MKTMHITLALLLTLPAFAGETDAPELNDYKDRLTLNARVGFNIEAKFGPRFTPDGLAYNYLDGYVLLDSAGNFDPTGTFPGITQNWGYDNSARQRDGSAPFGGYPTVAMTRLASATDPLMKKFDDDPVLGGEVVYSRRLYKKEKWRGGIEVAVNYTPVEMSESSVTVGSGVQDSFQYFNGTSPPDSPTANGQPFQGTFGPGGGYALISDTAVNPTAVPVSVASKARLDADIWGFRIGPYVEYQLHRRCALSLAAGLAVAIVDADASWSQTLTVNGVTDPTQSTRHDGDSDALWGWYAGANVIFHMNQRWDLTAGVQYQELDTYRQYVGSRQAELDLSKSLYFSIGANWKF